MNNQRVVKHGKHGKTALAGCNIDLLAMIDELDAIEAELTSRGNASQAARNGI